MRRPIVLHGGDGELLHRVGQSVAGELGLEFLDLVGQPWQTVSLALERGANQVVAVSSEVLLDRERRVEQLARATVVALGPAIGVLSEVKDGASRLAELLAGDFRECHGFFRGGEKVVDVVGAIRRLAEREPVAVAVAEQSYLVEVGRGVLEVALGEMTFGSSVMLYLTDANVERLHGVRLARAMAATGMRVVAHVLEPGEERKCLDTLGQIFDQSLVGEIDRTSWLVAAGGGVTTDIGGLTAALWMRGLRWVAIPTTLLAMVDASVGGKTAVDHGLGKNSVGAFWQPSRVFCDVEFLLTESERNYIGGLAEVVKTAIIGDRVLFEMLEKEQRRVLARELDVMADVVRRCVEVKARIVGLDAREAGLRAVLNLGHTIGHALEALGQYRRYTHGEAVSLGMVAALRLGVRLGHSTVDVSRRVERLLQGLGLPVTVEADELRQAAELLGHDKKRAGSSIRFVFARDIGRVDCVRIALEDVREAVRSLG